MNKRLPILLSLLALILLAASIAYWVLQLYQPQQRPLAAAPVVSQPEPSPDAAATLFGGQPVAAAISNFQLTGVVAAGSANSAAIIVADGAAPRAVRIGREVAPGIVVSEVHQRYVMLSDGGVLKRVELATDSRAPASMNAPTPMAQPAPAPMMAPPPGMEQQTAPGVVSAPPAMQSVPPAGGGPQGTPTTPENAQTVPEPAMDPGYDPASPENQQQFQQQQPQPQQQQQQQNNQVQMPPNAAPMNQPSQQNPVR